MKKLILALLAVSTISTADAQKNSVLVYGNAGLSTNQNDNGGGSESKDFNWHINPGVGFQFTDNITIGVQGGLWSEFSEVRSANAANTAWQRDASEYREWQAGAFFRYTKYFGNIFAMFTQVDLNYVSGQNVSEAETRMVDFNANQIVEQVIYNYDYYNGFQAFITPMISANVHKGLALNFGIGGLGYRTISYDTPKSPSPLNPTIDQSNFIFNFGNQFSFGITKNFACKCKTGNVKPGDDLRPMRMEAEDDDE